jgi:shikimate dehydrogenase
MALNFLSRLTGSFAMPAAENPTVAMVEAAYRHHRLDIRDINCEVLPDKLADAVKGTRAMGWIGFNCSIPHKVAVIEHSTGWAIRRWRSARLTARFAMARNSLAKILTARDS